MPALLVDDYENRYHPIEAPDPIEAIKIRMEEMQLKQLDLSASLLVGDYELVKERKCCQFLTNQK